MVQVQNLSFLSINYSNSKARASKKMRKALVTDIKNNRTTFFQQRELSTQGQAIILKGIFEKVKESAKVTSGIWSSRGDFLKIKKKIIDEIDSQNFDGKDKVLAFIRSIKQIHTDWRTAVLHAEKTNDYVDLKLVQLHDRNLSFNRDFVILNLKKAKFEDEKKFKVGRTEYNIGEVIQSGFFGTVYKAKKDVNEVALKKITVKIEEFNLLKNEIEIMRELKGVDNNVQLHEAVILSDNQVGIVMDFMGGGDLYDYGEDIDPDTKSGWKLLKQIVNGVKLAHDKDIVNHDLKRENILLDEDKENIAISDFGCGEIADENGISGKLRGTPLILAKECWQEQGHLNKQDSKKRDVFALGVVLYELITGSLHLYDKNIYEKPFKMEYKLAKPHNVRKFIINAKLKKGPYSAKYNKTRKLAILNTIKPIFDPDYKNRMSIDQLLQEMEKIEKNIDVFFD